MKMRDLITLAEGKYRKPILMYHGTSDILLRPILRDGVVPFPEKRAWADDPDTSGHALSRKSMGGSYWSSNLLTASSSYRKAVRTLGGRDCLIVCAMIAEQSAYADEDNLNHNIIAALIDTMKQCQIGSSMDSLMYLAGYYWGTWGSDEKRTNIEETFRAALAKSAKESFVISRETASAFLQAFALRALANQRGWGRDRQMSQMGIPEDFSVPSAEEAEHTCWELRKELTRTYRKSALRGEDHEASWHTLRTEHVVGYRGANKIVCLAVLNTLEGSHKTHSITVHYGELPEDFKKQYRERTGRLPEVLRPNGEVIKRGDED